MVFSQHKAHAFALQVRQVGQNYIETLCGVGYLQGPQRGPKRGEEVTRKTDNLSHVDTGDCYLGGYLEMA